MSTSDEQFQPDVNGFAWDNSFDGDDIVDSWFEQELLDVESAHEILSLMGRLSATTKAQQMREFSRTELLEELGGLVDAGGLSGGMVVEALHRFHRRRDPWKRRPGPSSQKFADLARHQFELLVARGRLNGMIADMVHPDISLGLHEPRSLADLSCNEWLPRIRRRLGPARPVPLILYLSKWNPFANKVVLAIDYAEESGGSTAILDLYDPDCPGRTTQLRVDLLRQTRIRLGPDDDYAPRHRKVRGFKRARHVEVDPTDSALTESLAYLAAT